MVITKSISKTLSAAVESIEDHGYILDLGMSGVSGFLSFKNAKRALGDDYQHLRLGQLVDVLVLKLSANARTCDVSIDEKSLKAAFVRALFTSPNFQNFLLTRRRSS
jgi:rRNA biogenesis protein RRP5